MAMIQDILNSIFNIKPIPKNSTKNRSIEIGKTKIVICMNLFPPLAHQYLVYFNVDWGVNKKSGSVFPTKRSQIKNATSRDNICMTPILGASSRGQAACAGKLSNFRIYAFSFEKKNFAFREVFCLFLFLSCTATAAASFRST